MSHIGKTVLFKTVDGNQWGGVVTAVLLSPWDETDVWYELDSGWTISEKHVVAANWNNGNYDVLDSVGENE